MWGAALDMYDVLLPYSIISLAYHITIILISTLFQTYKHIKYINIHKYSYILISTEPLFPGESCGALSDEDRYNEKGLHRRERARGREQLDLILQVIGTPTRTQVAHLDKDTQEYILTHRPQTNAVNLPTLYPAANQACIDLLRAMLAFNSDERVSVDAALNSDWLDSVRNENEETVCAEPLQSNIENEGETGKNLFRNVVNEVMHYRTGR